MALVHDFFIKEQPEIKNKLSDDIYFLIKDSLEWVNTMWANNEMKNGLDYYGTSEINGENLR